MPRDVAAAAYAELLHPTYGFFKTCELDPAGLTCVLELRERYASPAKRLGASSRYYDPQYSNAANI